MKRIRTWVIDGTITLMNWNERVFVNAVLPDVPINWRDHVRWWIEGKLRCVFSWAYDGSDEEIRDGIEHARDDVRDEFLTPRQLEIKRRWPEWIDAEETV